MTARRMGESGVLTRDVRVRVVNCSVSGCLLLSTVPVAVGTTASLQLHVEGSVAEDAVQIVRCQAIEGAGPAYHLGARFLWTAPPRPDSVRHLVPRLAANEPVTVLGLLAT